MATLADEFCEYKSAFDCAQDHNWNPALYTLDWWEKKEETAIDYLKDKTTVIQFDGGIIVKSF